MQLLDIDESDQTDDGDIASIMNPETGETVDDLRVPTNDPEYKGLRDALKEDKKVGRPCVCARGAGRSRLGRRARAVRAHSSARTRAHPPHPPPTLHTPPPQDIFVTVLGAMGIRKIQAQYATKDRQ